MYDVHCTIFHEDHNPQQILWGMSTENFMKSRKTIWSFVLDHTERDWQMDGRHKHKIPLLVCRDRPKIQLYITANTYASIIQVQKFLRK
jgi:hypothetical protein